MEVDLNKLLNCPLCFDILSKPMSLQCLHSFCERCIGNYIAANVNASLKCPVCRSPFNSKTPLSHDFFKQSLVDVAQSKSWMCRCRLHEAEKIIRFCRDCFKSLCVDCILEENHKGHNVVKAEVAEREVVEILVKQQNRVAQHINTIDKLWDHCVQQTNNEYDAVAIEAKNEVQRQVNEMCENVRKKAVDLTNEIDAVRSIWKLHVKTLPQHDIAVATLSELDNQLQKALKLPIEDKIKFCRGIEARVTEAISCIADWSVFIPTLKISFMPSTLPVNVGTLHIEVVEAEKKDMVFVQCMCGHHVTILVDLDQSVDKIKDQVAFKTGIPACAQLLFYKLKVLLPGVPLRQYGIERDATITLQKPALSPVSQN